MEVELTKRDQKRREKRENEIIEKIDNALNSIGEKALRETVNFINYYDLGVVFFDTESGRIMTYDRYRHKIHDDGMRREICSKYRSLMSPVDDEGDAFKVADKASFVVKC